MNIGYIKVCGARVLHTGIFNQEALAMGITKLVEACDRLGKDVRPILARTLIRVGAIRVEARTVRRRTLLVRDWYYIEAADIIMVFEGLADLLHRTARLSVPAVDLLRSITE
jgi:hypothetical protein